MTDFMLQATSRQDMLDDLAEALPLEQWVQGFFISSAGNLNDLTGGEITIKNGDVFVHPDDKEWRILISWKDNYSSGLKDGQTLPSVVPETRVNRGLHVNLRVVGDRGEEIAGLIKAHFATQTKSDRDMPEAVWNARKGVRPMKVHKTSHGTSWLQGDDPAEGGFVEHQSFMFG